MPMKCKLLPSILPLYISRPSTMELSPSKASEKRAPKMASFLGLYSLVVTLTLVARISSVSSATLRSDIDVLQSLKSGIDPNTIPESSFLSSWNFKVDPCESSGEHFLGILCTIPDGNESSRITTVDLDGMDYDGFLTKEIGNLTALVTLNLSKNKFRGPIPESVPNLKKLTKLDLSRNVFTGSILPGMKSLRRLQVIDLSYNKLTGTIPPWIANLRSLTTLCLAGNGFSGRIPNLAGLWQLDTLELSSNQFYGTIPQLPVNLRTLSLSNNILSGHIYSITRLQRLSLLDLSDNRLTGTLRSGILGLPEVTHVNVSFNWLAAMEVNNFFGRPTELQVLDVQENRLQGHLPANLVTIGNLTSINMGRNRFSGSIPASYGAKLGVWRSLYLDHNFLVGGLPTQFANSELRVKGSLSKNCLSCPVSIPLCHGGQRGALECIGQAGRND